MRLFGAIWAKVLRRPSLTLGCACLALTAHIALLMASNYKSQIALRESSLKRFRLDLEKRAASLEYFFSERKYDLRALAGSREIAAYFTNKALGMSEQYGLKVNLFLIDQMLEKAVAGKKVKDDPVYDRMAMADGAGRFLVDTPGKNDASPDAGRYSPARGDDPALVIAETAAGRVIMISAPCAFKGKPAGEVIAWLNLKTMARHFVDFSEYAAQKGFDLIAADGRSVCAGHRTACPDFSRMQFHDAPNGAAGVFRTASARPSDGDEREILAMRMPIHNTPLHLAAWVSEEELFGALAPWQLLAGAGAMALALIAGTGLLIHVHAKHLVLKAQFRETEQHQALLDRQVRERSRELTAANEDLKKEIEQRKKAENDLVAAYNELKETQAKLIQTGKLASIGELAAGVAHELNQPLMVIRTTSQIMMRNLEKLAPAQILEQLKNVERNTGRMMNIIGHLRTFSRQSPSVFMDVDLCRVMEDALLMVSEQLRLRNIRVEKHFAENPLRCRGNPNQLEQVFLNLITNARDAVTDRADAAGNGARFEGMLEITLRASDNGAQTEILFRDNGAGIAPDNMERLFDPFFTTKEVGRGTGLGLSISYGIIKDHGGEIAVTRTSPDGTEFAVRLPKFASGKANDNDSK